MRSNGMIETLALASVTASLPRCGQALSKYGNATSAEGSGVQLDTSKMTERKNLKIAEDTYDELREEKRDMETWDSMLRRLMRESD